MDTEQQQKILGSILRRKQNSLCADCNGKSPCWASLDFGVFVCLNCSGGHRALGPSVTRVKSTKLDTWNREWLENMQLGNSVLNEYWEYDLKGRPVKPNVNTSLKEIIRYVEDKYLRKKYVDRTQELDPLTRYKLHPISQNIIRNKEQNTVKVKEVAKVETKEQPQLYTNNKPNVEQHSGFSHANSEKKFKKPIDNLISFEDNTPKKTEQTHFGFQLGIPEQKNDKTQFHSTGNTNTSTSNLQIDFESLLKPKQHTESPLSIPPQPHHNHFINTPPAYGLHQHLSQSTPPFDKNNQYVTMNINMNMYPKVVNINMNQPYNHYNPYPQHSQQPNLNPQRPTYAPQDPAYTQQYNTQPQVQQNVFLNPPKQPGLMSNITLDTTINLQTANKTKPVSQPTSWADDWK